MKIGVNAFLWTAGFQKEHCALFPKIKEGGLDGIELVGFDFANFPAAYIRKELEATGIGATFCTALTGQQHMGSEDAGVRASTRQFLADAIRVCAESGAEVLAGPFFSAVGYLPGRRRTADEWKWAVENLRSLGEVCDQYNMDLAIEPLNRFECFTLNTADDAVKLCDEINHARIGILFDTFHANIEEKNLPAAFTKVARHLKHVHTCENDRGTPGTGHVDWDGVLKAIVASGYDKWMTIESFGPAVKEIATAACVWRDFAPSAEDIAFNGGSFLRRKLATLA